MDIREAKKIVETIGRKASLSREEAFRLTEALEYLIRETHETRWMVELGGYYYEEKRFDLALKYYEMADSYGDAWAPEGLGYIWYYGRTGRRDYEKAFLYYSKAAHQGQLKSKIKVADMYRNGYYVKKDEEKYQAIIEEAYEEVKGARYLSEPLPEVYTRLARVRTAQGRTEEAVDLYLEAKVFLAQRIGYTMFFGDLNMMKWLEEDLNRLLPVDPTDFDLFDLYVVLRTPARVCFYYQEDRYEVHSSAHDAGMAVQFGGSWYQGVDEFFRRADIMGKALPTLSGKLYGFEILK